MTSSNDLTATSENNTFNSNITLFTTYNSSPNTALPIAIQLNGIINVPAGSGGGVSSSFESIANITLSVGLWAIKFRIALTASTFVQLRHVLL